MFWHLAFCLWIRSLSFLFSISVVHGDLNKPHSENQSSGLPIIKQKWKNQSGEKLKSLLPMVDRIELASMKR